MLTIYPSLFRSIRPASYRRQRITTPDNDFLDLDFSEKDSDRAVVILHGLEGNSGRKYVLGMVHIFNDAGFDTVSLNFRGCSGEPNHQLRFYHSGETGDLHTVIQYLLSLNKYKTIHLVGFSLGGNVTLKYVGEKGNTLSNVIRSAVAISVPVDLKDSSGELEKRHNTIYMQRFIRDLGNKLLQKQTRFPGTIDLADYDKIKSFRQFDDRYTAPIHGFKDALTYWEHCSSKKYLADIRIPTLLINAKDDPFLGSGCFPYDIAGNSPYFHLETPYSGGHVGFVKFGEDFYWSEKRALAFTLSV
ncbi:YheT family hydrolase [Chitinophaga nivalis]|uniref:Alpha/beta fold hydrolase n=1 Tax=Chitinophaga nivalis TaxID=2991709 RepID=A0ABT3IG89_9BACT|nr:alpha/beta fold hydrolase [Chitinophaga nivalis]MCW3467334.1 alpha/beta fold hydrolase [Chitinophaga nivalis]MCW3482974.1 alpha/beta fold hydrolase [Chitinophaga nivalis]